MGGGTRENWHLIETLPLSVSGGGSVHREATILSLVSRRQSAGARSLDEDDATNSIAGNNGDDDDGGDAIDKPADDVRIRVRLCLRSSQTTCGDYTEAESEFSLRTIKTCFFTLSSFTADDRCHVCYVLLTFCFLVGANVKEQQAIATPTLIALVVSCVVFVLFVALLFVFCRCKRKTAKKTNGKEYEMDSST